MDKFPAGPFSCILADPPWSFRSWNGKQGTPHRGAHDHYRTMSIGDIAALPVEACAADDCALFLWVVDSHLDQALKLGSRWGFEFKTCAFVWVKSHKTLLQARVGMGFWTRKQTEQCWLFTRGKPKRLARDVRQIIYCPRGRHSEKPWEQYSRIERLVAGPYLELFARHQQPGWAIWGDQLGDEAA